MDQGEQARGRKVRELDLDFSFLFELCALFKGCDNGEASSLFSGGESGDGTTDQAGGEDV